jgi:polysaccharide biosynthesis transport protein
MPVMDRLSRETTPVVPPARTSLEKVRQRLMRTPMDPLREMRSGLSLAAWSLKAKSVTGTRIIAISTESTIPEIASNFVNTLAVEYIAQNTQQRSTTTQKTSQWLESQLEETKVKLEEAEGRLQAFQKQSGIVFGGVGEQQESQNTLASTKLRSLTSDLASIQQERITKQAKFDAVMDMIKKGTPELIPEIGDNLLLRSLQTKLAEDKKQYNDLIARYTATNPKVTVVQQEMDEIQAQLKRESDAIVQRIRNDYEQALNRESYLKKAYTAEAASMTGEQDKAAQYSLLRREVQIYQQTLSLMLAQVNQASVVAAVPANNIRVLDMAFPSGMPYKPDPTNFLTVGTIVGIGIGFGLVFLKERIAKAKSTLKFGIPGYAPSLLSVPELGVIPSADFLNGNGLALHGRARWVRKRIQASPKEESKALSLSGWHGGPSLLTESFRLTMISLMLMFRNSPRVLVVTSPGPGEGKTTVSSNLGMAMAEAGKKVLLIDMDLRRPQIHTLFGQTNDHGFSDLIRNSHSQTERITTDHPFLIPTPYPRLFLLPSGRVESTELGELFHSPRVPGLLRQLRECFDVMIIDTPPMLQFSESRLVGSFADGVLLVLRSGQTDKESALAAREQLVHDRVELLGTILNDWDPKQSRTSRSYSSYYTSYMRYHTKEDA